MLITHRWAAVAKGAVCYGLESIVRHRVLPCHYGVELGVAYDSSKGHDLAYNYRDEFYGVTMNRDTVVWFAKKVIKSAIVPFLPI